MDYLTDFIKKYKIRKKNPDMPPKMRTPLRTIYMEEIFQRERLRKGDSIIILAVNAHNDIFLWDNATYIKKDGPMVYFKENRYAENIMLPLDRVITVIKRVDSKSKKNKLVTA